MARDTQTTRERIGHALYMLAAGADQDVLMQTLRAYVLQHIATTEQAMELLRDLASVNPPAFAESLQMLAAERQLPDLLRANADMQRENAAIQQTLSAIKRSRRAATEPTANAQPKKLSKRSASGRKPKSVRESRSVS
jgi:hypothetical protein